MKNNDHLADEPLENLKSIEAELFGMRRSGNSGPRKSCEGEPGSDPWKLNREVLDAKRECSLLKGELRAAAILLDEQNVLAATSRSALKELQKDLALMITMFKEKEADVSELSSELGRLKAEIGIGKKHHSELKEKLASEAVRREDLENALREYKENEEALRLKVEALEKKSKDVSSEPQRYPGDFRPLKFTRRYF